MQDRAGPLPGQRIGDVLFADESQGLQPFADAATASRALGFESMAQLIDGELLAREQDEPQRNTAGGDAFGGGAGGAQSIVQRALDASFDAVPGSANEYFCRLAAPRPPQAMRLGAFGVGAADCELVLQPAPGLRPGIEMKACRSHIYLLQLQTGGATSVMRKP